MENILANPTFILGVVISLGMVIYLSTLPSPPKKEDQEDKESKNKLSKAERRNRRNL